MHVAEGMTKNPAQSPTRRSPRRTRSNNTAVEDAVADPARPSTSRGARNTSRESISDQNEQTAPLQTHDGKDSEQSLIDEPSDVTDASGSERRPAGKLLSDVKHNKRDNDHDKATGNELTKLIPGYVAPLQLDTSLLDAHRPSGGLDELTRKAQETDASTAGFVVTASESHAQAMKRMSNGCMPSTYTSLYSSFQCGTKRPTNPSAGAGWFDMVPTPMTDELKTDLAMIRNRNYLDPKRFYKSADDNQNKILQLGTVVEGAAEFYSSRLVKKQRRANLTEEIMADPAAADYTRNKYKRMQQEKTEKARKYNKKKKMSKRGRRGY